VIRGLALLSSAVDIRKEIRLGVRYSDELRMSVRRRDVTLVADVGGVNVSRFEVSKQQRFALLPPYKNKGGHPEGRPP
jgi:hypothetical protein